MAHIGIVSVSEPRYGGTFQYSLSMIEALHRIEDHHYTIFTTRHNHAYDHFGSPVVRLPASALALAHGLGVAVGMNRWCELFPGTDKLIAPRYTTYLLASRRPFAFTLHDLQERYFPENFNMGRRLWRFATNNLLAHRAARIVCESGQVRDDITRFLRVEASRVSVIPAPPVSSFLDADASRAALDGVRVRFQLPEQYILYPAQFYAHKNHLRLVEAFARVVERHPRVQLALTGTRRFAYDRVMARVAQLGLTPRVRHLGQLEVGDLALVYKLARLVAIPTLFESISIPVYEAWIMGVPVCASSVVALPEQIGDAGVLFDPLSVEDIATKICAVLDDEALRATLVARGRQRIAALTMDRYAQQLRAMLAQVGKLIPVIGQA